MTGAIIETMNISEKINAFIDECGGERDAVNVALTKIETLEAQLEATRELFIDSETASIAWSETSAKTSTRLIATKFVADEAVGLVKELERALKNIAGFDHFISEEKARGVFIANVYPAIAKAANSPPLLPQPPQPSASDLSETT